MADLSTFLAYRLSAINIAIKQMVECLERNGALREGQFQDAIRSTLDQAGDQRGRQDYVALADLLDLLEDNFPSPH